MRQTEQALVLRFGDPIRVITEPGLNFKVPFIDTVVTIDNRILDLENPAQEVIASDQKRLVVDAFARYRIRDPLRFYQTIGTIRAANLQLSALLNAALRRVLGETTFTHVVRDERAALMARIREQLDQRGRGLRHHRGRRPHPPRRPARAELAGRLPAHADRAPARGGRVPRPGRAARRRRSARAPIASRPSSSPRRHRQAEQIRGQGDGERNRIFAEAYGRDREFFAFYRSMQAYETGLRPNDTRLLLKPDSDFFRFFGSAGRQAAQRWGCAGDASAPAR